MGRNVPNKGSASCRICFTPGGTVEALPGETILDAAWRGGIPLEAPCGGQGICGRCRIRLRPTAPPVEEERRFFSAGEINEGWRLACRSPVAGQSEVLLTGREPGSVPVLTFVPPRDGQPMAGGGFGAAVDMGTTTIAVQLWDLAGGRLVATVTGPNPQRSHGADVISRISAAAEEGALHTLRDRLRRGVSDLVADAAKRADAPLKAVNTVVLSGNTVMQHFFMGVDPTPIARAPFAPAFLRQPTLTGRRVGLDVTADAAVRLVPCASAFIGGDAVAGVTALLAEGCERPALLIDMGTNAETVLLRERSIIATSAAAGPALEGGNISSGLSAGRGAVERIDFTGDISLQVIGGGPPRGICGSGLLELAALLLRFGILLPDGRLQGAVEAAAGPWRKLSRRLSSRDGMNQFRLAAAEDGGPSLAVTQEDFRQLQLARSAIVTAWESLLRLSRVDPHEISRVFVAGGYGYSLRPETLARTGLLHEAWLDRLSLAGNISLAGASRMLLDAPLFDEAAARADSIRALHLAESPSFQKHFIANLAFPED